MHRLRYAAPQWQSSLKATVLRAKARAAHALVDGVDWYWPAGETLPGGDAPERCGCWRRSIRWSGIAGASSCSGAGPTASRPTRREAKRKLGYYALPLLWRDRVIGWANLTVVGGALQARVGYVSGRRPRERAFTAALDAEIDAMGTFLGEPRPAVSPSVPD